MNEIKFKDLFSVQSGDYAKYRPTYPPELFSYLAGLSQHRDVAWDCGTGNGQAAVELAGYFNKVIATDLSEKQILEAKKHSKILYKVSTAENFECNEKIDLITVAQAFHWFNHKSFAEVVGRVARSGGHLAVWTYAVANITPEVDAVVDELYNGILKGYWEPERAHVESGYKNIIMPFKEISHPDFEMNAEWSLEHFIGYLSTWSALQSYIKKNEHNPLEETARKLEIAWGRQNLRKISWPLGLRIWEL
ncbi:MAG: class I SAM-dependent methyltransferase [Bacteriovorax sp.]|jgi:SAM-dependent methyltransferase